jgi:hypothetical protein
MGLDVPVLTDVNVPILVSLSPHSDTQLASYVDVFAASEVTTRPPSG